MRQDMKKVLTESPRRGSGDGYREYRRKENSGDLEDLPTHQGMRVPYVKNWGDHKEFSDHLGPLIRYLWGSIGRPWNDVWSEVCACVPSGNTVDDHLKDHVVREVEIYNYVGDDGEVYCKPTSRNRFGSRYGGPTKPRGLYVDPRDGLLKAGSNDESNSRRKRFRQSRMVSVDGVWYDKQGDVLVPTKWATQKETIKLLDGQKAIKMDGIWYLFDYGWLEATKKVNYIEDGEMKTKFFPNYGFDEYNRCQVSGMTSGRLYHKNKRQMNSRDLKRHGLQNDQVAV